VDPQLLRAQKQG